MRTLVAFGICVALVLDAIAAEPKHTIVVDDYFTIGTLGEIAVSSAAKSIAYTEGRWQEATNDRKSDLWVVSVSGDKPRRLTFDRAGYDSLRFSPDGRFIYCVSRSPGKPQSGPPLDGSRQIWRIALDGSGSIPISRVEGGIEGFDLSAGGEWAVFIKSTTEDQKDWAGLRSRFPEIKYGGRPKTVTTFYKLDLKTLRTTPMTTIAGAVDEFSLSPNGKRIAMVTAPDSRVISMEGKSRMTILEIADGRIMDLPDNQWRKDLPSPYGRLAQPQWSVDGRALAFAVGFDAHPSEVFVAAWNDQPQPEIRKIQRPGRVSLHGGVDGGLVLRWRGDTRDLCFLGDDHARVRIYCAKEATNGGPVEPLTDSDEVIDTFVWDQNGTSIAAIRGSPEKMNDVYLLRSNEKEWKQLTDINSHTRNWNFPKISIVQWAGNEGEQVEGVLELPADYQLGTPLPMIVNLHGGPTYAVPYHLAPGLTGSVLYAGQGYAFFSPNYRGSTGYGDKFITDLIGRENEIELADILSGVDKLIADGIVDPERIAVAGWSNGGYLTNCLIAKTDRFKAASSGAGIVDVAMVWGANDEPAFPMNFNRGTPWEAPDSYQRTSPIFNFGKVKTPTLFHVGEHDPRCPRGQTDAAYRALKEYLNVETELLIYPGEEHGLDSYSNCRAKLTWEFAWFDHFVKGRPKQ